MSFLTDTVPKIFLIVFGLVVVVTLVVVVNNIGSTTCVPELYGEGVIGFGGGFLNSIFDSLCLNVVDANNAVWNFYDNILSTAAGQRGNIAAIGADMWSMGRFFCQTHSNFDYASSSTGAAIKSTETFKDLFSYELDRCWTIFEGNTSRPLSDRHPLGKTAIHNCAEIIYDFSGFQDEDVPTLAELFAKLNYKNYCGDEFNAPLFLKEEERCTYDFDWDTFLVSDPECEDYNAVKDSIMWCAPKEEMEDFWVDNESYIQPSKFRITGPNVDKLECDTEPEIPKSERTYFKTSACIPYAEALCSFGEVDGYSFSDKESDESTIIDGCGRIVISYFDYFDFATFLATQKNSDTYAACDFVNVFNDFEPIVLKESEKWWLFDITPPEVIVPREQNSILICYEKYDEEDCSWSEGEPYWNEAEGYWG